MVRYFNRGDVYAIAIVLPILATLAVAARVWVRRYKDVALGVDDYTIIVALALTWSLGVILIDGTAYDAFGTHTAVDPVTGQNIPGLNAIYDSELYYIFNIIFILTIGILKVSVMLLYRRIFHTHTFQRLSILILIFIAGWSTAFFFARAFACGSHFSAFWGTSKSIVEYCGSYQAIELGFGVSDIATDLIVLATPVPSIWKLQMPRSQKVAVTAAFLLGLLSTASAAVRVAFLILEEYETRPVFRDVIGVGTLTLGWSQVEAGIGIIAACLPTLRPLFLGKAPESLINSIRSALSLSSGASGRSRRQRTDTGNERLANTSAERGAGVHIQDSHTDARSPVTVTSNPAQLPAVHQPDDAIELQNMSSGARV